MPNRIAPATNIVELLEPAALAELLLFNGFPTDGSDYERFLRLCTCVQRAPSEPIAVCLRAWLERLGCTIPVDPAHGAQIWIQAATALLEEGATLKDPVPLNSQAQSQRAVLPELVEPVTACPPLCGATEWSAWKALATRALPSVGAVRIDLPANYRATRPNLWRVERLLRGEITDPDCARSQQFDFLCGVCSAKRRLYLSFACGADEVLSLLRWTARRHGGLPPMIIAADPPPERAWLSTVAARIRTPVGLPPVLCVLKEPDERLPESICVRRGLG